MLRSLALACKLVWNKRQTTHYCHYGTHRYVLAPRVPAFCATRAVAQHWWLAVRSRTSLMHGGSRQAPPVEDQMWQIDACRVRGVPTRYSPPRATPGTSTMVRVLGSLLVPPLPMARLAWKASRCSALLCASRASRVPQPCSPRRAARFGSPGFSASCWPPSALLTKIMQPSSNVNGPPSSTVEFGVVRPKAIEVRCVARGCDVHVRPALVTCNITPPHGGTGIRCGLPDVGWITKPHQRPRRMNYNCAQEKKPALGNNSST